MERNYILKDGKKFVTGKELQKIQKRKHKKTFVDYLCNRDADHPTEDEVYYDDTYYSIIDEFKKKK